MKTLILQFFTWWNGATLNTLWWSSRHGTRVGEAPLTTSRRNQLNLFVAPTPEP